MTGNTPTDAARFAHQLCCAVQLASASPGQLADQARGLRRMFAEKPECAAGAEFAVEIFLATPTLKGTSLAARANTRLMAGRRLLPEQELLLCVFAGEDATEAYLAQRKKNGGARAGSGSGRPRNAEADRTRRLAAAATLRYKEDRKKAQGPPPDAGSMADFPALPAKEAPAAQEVAAPAEAAVPVKSETTAKPRWADMSDDED